MANKIEDLEYVQYKYRVSWSYNCQANGKVYDLLPSQIHLIIIDKYFDKSNMPLMYINANIDKNMLDKIIKGKKTDTFYLNLKKYNVDDPAQIAIDYINKRFVYFLNTEDANYTKNYDYDNEDDKEREDIYNRVTIGLMDYEAIRDNLQINYGVFNGSIVDNIRIDTFNNIDVIHRFTKHMRILIEPMVPKDISEMPLSPDDSVSKIIKQIDDFKTLYDTNYRFFIDFDKAYLLSSSGKSVPSIDDDINSIICNIINAEVPEDQGIAIYNDSYIFNINSKFTNFLENNTTSNVSANINAVSGIGDLSDKNSLKLIPPNINIGTKNSQLIRVSNSNEQKIKNMKNEIDTNQIKLIIKKAHVDIDAFKINKEFNVNNHDSKSDLNGRFIISRMQEYYSFEENELVLMVMLILRKL